MEKQKRNTKVQDNLPLKSGKMKLSGFDNKPLKQTTPQTVQEAATEYFDKESVLKKYKEAALLALEHIIAEMEAAGIKSAVVRTPDEELRNMRIKTSNKLEIRRQK